MPDQKSSPQPLTAVDEMTVEVRGGTIYVDSALDGVCGGLVHLEVPAHAVVLTPPEAIEAAAALLAKSSEALRLAVTS